VSTLNDLKDGTVVWRQPTLPNLTTMQESLNAHAERMAAVARGAFPLVFMAGIEEGVPLADQEIPPEGTE